MARPNAGLSQAQMLALGSPSQFIAPGAVALPWQQYSSRLFGSMSSHSELLLPDSSFSMAPHQPQSSSAGIQHELLRLIIAANDLQQRRQVQEQAAALSFPNSLLASSPYSRLGPRSSPIFPVSEQQHRVLNQEEVQRESLLQQILMERQLQQLLTESAAEKVASPNQRSGEPK